MYYLDLVPSPLSFRGYGEYAVRQDAEGAWAWSNIITNTTMATLSQEDVDLNYPVGRLTWNLQNPVCHQEAGRRVLTLSSCTVSQFTCSDGSCVDFAKRCDLKFDCDDKTDESDCDIINFPKDYRSKLPPRPASDSSLPISLNVTMDTLNIDTTTMLLSVSYNLRMTWLDNRLTYNNLKNMTRLNTVSLKQVEGLWRPRLGFINTDDIQNTAVDADAVTMIIKLDQSFAPDLSNPYEVEIYRGDTNPVSTIRKYSTVYTCNFDLVLYPFDIQNCYMVLQVLSASSDYLIYDAGGSSVEYLGPTLLVEYGIGRIDLQVDNATQYAVARVRIELIRRYGYAMLNIYIPSLTLLIISYVTLFFRPSIFEVRVMTALTSLLVLATLFTQVSASLPKTSYFKMVDIWLLFCIVLIFFIILFHTVIDRYVDYSAYFGAAAGFKEGTWLRPLSGSRGASTIKVLPADLEDAQSLAGSGRRGSGTSWQDKLRNFSVDLDFCLNFSKASTFSMFLLFNLVYWGKLAAGSGLVYYLYN
ncbi:glutamate-gated chloride channel alpha-like [Penaeus monodon]|uniref:glutamate-gated chloride channel alpha-like n=1 Tax=Penaeus monodon TaxID=6687 RepID=UPI0018A7BDDC|nr:glutamate-gated chloride channel alpha-like [Penaeus monodon]